MDEKKNILLIVDYSYFYYRYKMLAEMGKLKRLSHPVEYRGIFTDMDVTEIYYTLRDLENNRRALENVAGGSNVYTLVCMDSPCKVRKEASDSAYKSKRSTKLTEIDFKKIEVATETMRDAGHNVIKLEGFEADDIISAVARHEEKLGRFNAIVILTSDKDLLMNVSPGLISVLRCKSGERPQMVTDDNFESYAVDNFGSNIPFNSILMFLATVGDRSDNVPGIKGFGKAAFTKMVNTLKNYGVTPEDWKECYKAEKVEELLGVYRRIGEISDNQLDEALKSLNLVKPLEISEETLPVTYNLSLKSLRSLSYSRLGMVSLIE